MSGGRRRPRYELVTGDEVLAEVAALAAYEAEVVAAAASIIDDPAHGR